jgi:hypothetical protein
LLLDLGLVDEAKEIVETWMGLKLRLIISRQIQFLLPNKRTSPSTRLMLINLPALAIIALSEEEHVALIQRTMVEVHGEIAAEQFTGVYDRQAQAPA